MSMKKIVIIAGMLVISASCFAQLSGTVMDAISKEKIPGAVVELENSFLVASTDEAGKFLFPDLKTQTAKLKISHIGFESKTVDVPSTSAQLEISLSPKTYIS